MGASVHYAGTLPMTREEIDRNAETYKQQVFKVLDRDTKPAR